MASDYWLEISKTNSNEFSFSHTNEWWKSTSKRRRNDILNMCSYVVHEQFWLPLILYYSCGVALPTLIWVCVCLLGEDPSIFCSLLWSMSNGISIEFTLIPVIITDINPSFFYVHIFFVIFSLVYQIVNIEYIVQTDKTAIVL